MAWFLALLALSLLGIVWIAALLVSEIRATSDDPVRDLTDPTTTPIAPFGPLIRLWLRLTRPA